MSEHVQSVVVTEGSHELSYRKYIIGFVSSIVLTLTAYLLVTNKIGSTAVLVGVLSFLAVIQFLVQLVFFLHLGEERKPRWKLFVMLFMFVIAFLIIVGSIWIMNNLNYRMMASPKQMEQYMRSQNGGI